MKHLITLTLLVAPAFVVADDDKNTKEACKVMDVANISYVENIQAVADADVGAIYKTKTDKVLAFCQRAQTRRF